MKRRDFVKSIPAVAVLPIAASVTAENAEAAQAGAGTQPSGKSPQQPKGFSVANKTHDDPRAYDNVHCDQFGIDSEGNPIAEGLTGTGSDASLKEHDPDKPHKMTATSTPLMCADVRFYRVGPVAI